MVKVTTGWASADLAAENSSRGSNNTHTMRSVFGMFDLGCQFYVDGEVP
jgi:hypothetical protein